MHYTGAADAAETRTPPRVLVTRYSGTSHH